MKQPQDIDAQSVDFSIRMHERAAVDAEFSKHYQRQLDEREARNALVSKFIEEYETDRLTTLEVCLFAIVALASVGIIAYAACEIFRLIDRYGF